VSVPSVTVPVPTAPPAAPAQSQRGQATTSASARAEALGSRLARAVAYKRAYSELPFHSPPLNVTQIVTWGRPGPLLDARVGERSFLCDKTPTQRRAAVRSYYELVLERVRAEGQSELRLRVSRFEPTASIRHVYALADGGPVTLTAEGAGRCPT